MASIFSKIVNGEIPCYKIAEDEHHLAFLDVMPIAKGHTLVIPKKEVDYIFDLDEEEYKNLWAFAQKVAKKVKAAIPCVKVGVAVVGLEVPHTHIHLVPINEIKDLNFMNKRLNFTPEEYEEIRQSIANH
jgi:hypothetical protein